MDYQDRLQPSRRHVVRSRVGRPDPREVARPDPQFAIEAALPPMPPAIGPDGATLPKASAPAPARVRNFLRRRGEEGKVGLAILLWLLGVPGILVLLYLLLG